MTANEVRIELGASADLDPYVALLEGAAIWLRDRGIHQWAPGTMRAQAPAFAARALAGQLLVARSRAAVVGGCLLMPDPDPEWAGRAGRALFVHKLVVARSHAGRGLALRLLDACEERARALGVPRLRLDCWDGNATLRAFYRHAGYRELEAVLSDGCTARLFEREVSPDPRQGVTPFSALLSATPWTALASWVATG